MWYAPPFPCSGPALGPGGVVCSVGYAPSQALASPYAQTVGEVTPSSTGPWAALYVPATLDKQTVEDFAEVLTRQNERWLMAHPETPWLYQTPARYKLQPEFWLSIPWALYAAELGYGLDCKVLAAWRAAEIRVREGDPKARCIVTEHPRPGQIVYHVRVSRGFGGIEDPSELLGMTADLGIPEASTWDPYRLH